MAAVFPTLARNNDRAAASNFVVIHFQVDSQVTESTGALRRRVSIWLLGCRNRGMEWPTASGSRQTTAASGGFLPEATRSFRSSLSLGRCVSRRCTTREGGIRQRPRENRPPQ